MARFNPLTPRKPVEQPRTEPRLDDRVQPRKDCG